MFMNEALVQIRDAEQLMTWALILIAFLTFLGVVWSAYMAVLVRREGRESRRETSETRRETSEILMEMREDSKRMQYYLFSKFSPADLK
jgi:hypothetical protein